jgi:hypothetical protein
LDHTISSEGISVDPSKVQEVMDWKPPTSVHQIRSFLGLVGYYRHFISDFSRIAKPLTELLKKGVKFVWSKKCEKAFHTLHEHLTTAPVHVAADALSRKAHCNCLSVEFYNETICHEMRKLNLEMIPQGTLNHISVEPTLQDHIIMAQLHDEGVKIIKQKLSQERRNINIFAKTRMEFYGLNLA